MEEILREEPALAEDWLKRWGDQRIAGGWVMDCEGSAYTPLRISRPAGRIDADRTTGRP